MINYSASAHPIVLNRSTESQVYGLCALALGLTFVGIFIGIQTMETLFSSGVYLLFLILELVIIFTSRLWVKRSPLNLILFATFPILSGLTITPLILTVLSGYANGASILLNATSATIFMSAAAAVFAKTTRMDLSVLGQALFLGVLGLIFFAVLQIFVPAFRTAQVELLLSLAGIVIFALFLAYDIQRVSKLSQAGASPIILALSLYLDIFNLFLYVLRFMLAISGQRR